MPPANDDMVVADGVLEQIRLQIDIERDLRATEMVTVRHLNGSCFGDKETVEFWATPFK